ncbi:MAG TPA: hypothetical protein VJ201_08015 [Candidatus Babeliales bacterium]|nr:hypothetical protein [Candidatus Babeliales bacterium]
MTSLFIITMITSMPIAAAQSTPSIHDVTPLGFPDNCPNSRWSIESDVDEPIPSLPNNVDIAHSMIFIYFDSDLDFAAPGTPAGALSLVPEVGDRMWVLVTGADPGPYTIVKAEQLDVNSEVSSLFADRNELSSIPIVGGGFGTGGDADEGVATPATASFTNLIGGIAKWREKTTGGLIINVDDDTATPGLYFAVWSAHVETDDDRIWEFPGEDPNVIAESFSISPCVVGGESLPLSTSALLLAGTQTNALWILPILGLAGTVIAIRKLEA